VEGNIAVCYFGVTAGPLVTTAIITSQDKNKPHKLAQDDNQCFGFWACPTSTVFPMSHA